MVGNRLIRGAGIWTCTVLFLAGVAAAQDVREREGRGHFPPPTFFAPPGSPTNGAIIMHPPLPPGNTPQMFWQRGGEPQEMIKPSDHWVGLQCGRMDPALQAQLGLDEGKGVLVEAIVEESPAAKAGIEKFDVLIRAGDRELTKVQDLIDEVDKVKDGKLSIELIRKGEKKTVEITPEKRPPIEALSDETVGESPEEWKNFFDYMQQWEPGRDGRPSMKFRFWRQPGTILPGEPNPAEKLPDNVKILIRKQGENPAEIEVTRDGESWSVNEDELDKLPGDLRPHIERMLGAAHGPAGRWGIPPEGFKLPEAAQDWGSMIEKRFEEMNRRIDRLPNPLEGREGVLEKRFQEMNRRLDQLRDSLDELRGRRPEKPKEEMKDKPKAQPESKDQPKAEAEPEAPKPKSSGKEV
jgi:hypothetical protein